MENENTPKSVRAELYEALESEIKTEWDFMIVFNALLHMCAIRRQVIEAWLQLPARQSRKWAVGYDLPDEAKWTAIGHEVREMLRELIEQDNMPILG